METTLLPISSHAFRSMTEFAAFADRNKEMMSAIWNWSVRLGNRGEAFQLGGYCSVCERATTYFVSPRSTGNKDVRYRVRWAGLRCGCGLSATERRVLSILQNRQSASIYHVGYFSGLSKHLAENYQSVERSQFKEGMPPGFVDENGIRYEDLTRLSFASESFDHVVCTEVLEHVPNYLQALQEMRRCLVPGGSAILTFPWLGGTNYAHRERARLGPDGSIEHLLPPSYHGDPASPDGILCFRDFGWQVLDDLRAVGYSDAYALYLFSPVHGYMTMTDPLIVATR